MASRLEQTLFEQSGYSKAEWCFVCFKGNHSRCSGHKRDGPCKCKCRENAAS